MADNFNTLSGSPSIVKTALATTTLASTGVYCTVIFIYCLGCNYPLEGTILKQGDSQLKLTTLVFLFSNRNSRQDVSLTVQKLKSIASGICSPRLFFYFFRFCCQFRSWLITESIISYIILLLILYYIFHFLLLLISSNIINLYTLQILFINII